MDFKIAYDVSQQLDAQTLAVAKKELNEKDVKQRQNDIEAIREWILKQDYMTSKIDDDFILGYLRAAKYSYSRTQELIGNFWRNRTEIDFFKNRSFEEDSVMLEVADLGVYVKLPYPDKEGRVVIIQRIGVFDPEKYDFDDVARYIFSCLDVVCMDPKAAINGVQLILDMTGMNSAHASQMNPARAQKMMKCFQDAYPMRLKSVNYYNYPKVFDAVFPIVKMFMKEKLKKRLKFHGSDLKSLQKEFSKSILPKEYGGELGPIMKINEAWVDHLRTQKKMLIDLGNYGVDLAKMPKTDKETAKSTVAAGVTGTFRKLNVD